MDKDKKPYREVKLEMDGHFGPHCVFNICGMKDIFSINSKLDALW